MKYSVQFFIDKFSKIPANQWTVGTLQDKRGRKCVMGHCGFNLSKITSIGIHLEDLFWNKLQLTPVDINDGRSGGWKIKGSTPKTRILNALKLIKEKANK